MNVTLIYPLLSRKRSVIDENKQYWPPLGLAYIAAMLERKGHKVQIIDRDVVLRKNDMDFDRVDKATLESIKDFDSEIVGISATTPNMSDVNYTSGLIKEHNNNCRIVLGGPHPSGEPVLSLEENPAIDIVVRGEGEFTMCDISSGISPTDIKGITYRDGERIVSNVDRESIRDIDELPMPARHLLDMKFYTRPNRFTSRNLSLKTTSIFTARGCPYRCNFCAGPLIFNGKVRFHSSGRVISEIEELITKYSIEALYFAEDMFLSSKKRAEEILNFFLEKGINKRVRWFAQAKASIITEGLLRLMKRAGCVGIEYGFESGSQRVLGLMNKNLNVEDSLRAAELTRKARLRFQANIIVGYPGERESDFRETIAFIRKIKPSMIGFNIFMPLPGTPSYEKLKVARHRLPRWDEIGDPEAPQVNFADMAEGVFAKLYLEARLKVILPMNLRSFIYYNIRNPVRLLKVGLTQFNGVLVKTARSVSTLRSLNKNAKILNKNKSRVLFLAYNGLLEPILPSQAVPYISELAKKNYHFFLFTYEKKSDLRKTGPAAIKRLKEDLRSRGVEWYYLKYHKSPKVVSTMFDLLVGTIYCFYLILKNRIRLVHVRGITPGVIMIILSKIINVKILFDMRGLLAEEYVGGGLWKESGPAFNLVKKAERSLLKTADAVTVLTNKHLAINKDTVYIASRKIPMDVVPCCVDPIRFYPDASEEKDMRGELGLNGKFVLMYPGKIGTFYFMEEMLDFFKTMLSDIPDAIFLVLTNDDTQALLKASKAKHIAEGKLKVIYGLTFEEMPRYMRIADAGIFFINPYKKIGSSPIKMGEFLSSGVPVIINPGIGDTEEMVKEERVGVVVEKFGHDDYREALRKLLVLKEEGENLRIRCRVAAQKHLSLEHGVERYHSIYKALI